MSLNQRILGRTGRSLTELTFGAMRLSKEEKVSKGLLSALENGINSIDTARIYGDSEEIIASTLKEWSGPQPFISTKIVPSPGDWRNYCELEQAFTPESMRQSVETSLKKLNVDTLDCVFLHQWFYLWTHRIEWLETFQDLKKEGKIKAFGISAQDHEHDAILQAVDMGLVDVVQIIFNVFESRPLVSCLPLCEKKNVGVIARCVLDDGALTGLFPKEQFEKNDWLNSEFYSNYTNRVEAIKEKYCDDSLSMTEFSIRFALSHPAVTTLTMSMQNPDFVESNINAVNKGPLAPEIVEDIQKNYVWTKNFFEPSFGN